MASPARLSRRLGCLYLAIPVLSFFGLRALTTVQDWTWWDLWRAPAVGFVLYTMAVFTRVVTCYRLHPLFKCHRHSGTKAWRCWILDALTFGRLGHEWVAPGVQIDMRRSSRWWFWPIVYEGTITVKGETMEMISDRLDLPAPMRMNAACTACGSVWIPDEKALNLIEKIGLLDYARKSPPPEG